MQHPWVNQAGQLSLPGLEKWGPHSRLSAVVQEAQQGLLAQAQGGGSAVSSRPGRILNSISFEASNMRQAITTRWTLARGKKQQQALSEVVIRGYIASKQLK